MKAVVCREHGLPDKLKLVTDWSEPTVGDHDVLIDVKAAGLNFPDVLMIQGKYQIKPDFPFSPGAEFSGEVSAVGEGVSTLAIGDKVVGTAAFGAYAEEVLTDALVIAHPARHFFHIRA